MTTRSIQLRQFVPCRRGAIFITAMWVLVIIGGMVMVFARSMRVEALASANRLAELQATAIERGAEQYVLSQVDGTLGDAVSITSIPGQAIQVGEQDSGGGYFWLIRPNPDDDQNLDFGIIDEASKLNLNYATDEMMTSLPNVTQDICDSIVDWRDPDETVTGQGAESSYYQSLPEGYNAKNANFETVEELLLVKGVDDSLLYGQDLNHNGVIEPGEQLAAASGKGTTGGGTGNVIGLSGGVSGSSGGPSGSFGGTYSDTRGMFPFVTVYTVEPNTDSNGKARINLNDPNSRGPLATLLGQTLSSARVEQVIEATSGRGAVRQFASTVAWYQASGLQPTEFGPIADSLTTTPAKTLNGMVNINTAPRQVLLCLPGLQQSDAEQIIASRGAGSGGITGAGGSGLTVGSSSNATAPSGDLTWLFQAVSPQVAASIAPKITTRSFQYSADIVAVSGDGRGFKRVRIVIDARTSPAVILYRKDLTAQGWPLPANIRAAMADGNAPPLIQSTGGSGLTGH